MKDVLSRKEMRECEKNTFLSGITSKELIKKVSKEIFESVNWQGNVIIVCGKGNNAADGYSLALDLKKSGTPCAILCVFDVFSEEGKYYFDKCKKEEIEIFSYIDNFDFTNYDIIVDCIFGIGFHGEMDERTKNLIKGINSSGKYIVSVDINSGLDSDSGICHVCVKSDLTVSVGYFKSGHFLNMAKDVMKNKINKNADILKSENCYHLIEQKDVKECFPERKNFSNKGDYGYVTLIGGSIEYSGAVKLANLALSSLKCGAGVARLAIPCEIANSVSPYMVETTLFPLKSDRGYVVFDKDELDNIIKSSRVICLGMGLGQGGDNEKIIEYILKNYSSVFIIDADGLNSLSKMKKSLLLKTKCKVVLTPHPKEFSRLNGLSVDEILKDPINSALNYAKETNTVLLLKGTSTVITDGDDVYITDTGSCGMATAGSGDVLSGIICGICSQNIEGSLALNVASGAYVNGLSGEIACEKSNPISMTSLDTVNAIPLAISKILSN